METIPWYKQEVKLQEKNSEVAVLPCFLTYNEKDNDSFEKLMSNFISRMGGQSVYNYLPAHSS